MDLNTFVIALLFEIVSALVIYILGGSLIRCWYDFKLKYVGALASATAEMFKSMKKDKEDGKNHD